jgi:hypothetical protein
LCLGESEIEVVNNNCCHMYCEKCVKGSIKTDNVYNGNQPGGFLHRSNCCQECRKWGDWIYIKNPTKKLGVEVEYEGGPAKEILGWYTFFRKGPVDDSGNSNAIKVRSDAIDNNDMWMSMVHKFKIKAFKEQKEWLLREDHNKYGGRFLDYRDSAIAFLVGDGERAKAKCGVCKKNYPRYRTVFVSGCDDRGCGYQICQKCAPFQAICVDTVQFSVDSMSRCLSGPKATCPRCNVTHLLKYGPRCLMHHFIREYWSENMLDKRIVAKAKPSVKVWIQSFINKLPTKEEATGEIVDVDGGLG